MRTPWKVRDSWKAARELRSLSSHIDRIFNGGTRKMSNKWHWTVEGTALQSNARNLRTEIAYFVDALERLEVSMYKTSSVYSKS